MPSSARQKLDAALRARAELLADPQTTVARVFNGLADGIDGLVIEKYGNVLIAQLHEGRLSLCAADVHDLCRHVAERLEARAVYRKLFPKDRSAALKTLEQRHSDPLPWIGTCVDAEIAVLEGGQTFLVRPYDGFATGLFLDHRLNRACIRGLATGRRVLNAFAYTCAYAVAAAAGGAFTTVNVDVSKKSLAWGRRNLAVNGLSLDLHRFICADVLDYCRRAQRHDRRFDLIILDPPTFSRARRPTRVFSIEQDLDRLVAGAFGLLSPDAWLLLSVNHRGSSIHRLEECVRRAAAAQRRRLTEIRRQPLPEDFRGAPDQARSVLVHVG